MSTQSTQSSAPRSSAQESVHDVLVRFDAYARVRGRRDSIFEATRPTPEQEQRAFDDLVQAVTRLRNTSGP